MRFQAAAVVRRCLVKNFPESPGEGGVVAKAAIKAYLGQWQTAVKHRTGLQQAFVGDILMDAIAGFGFETAHHMIFAHEKACCQTVYG